MRASTSTFISLLVLAGCHDSANLTSRTPLDAEPACGELDTVILAGQHDEAGSLVVRDDGESILAVAATDTSAGWYFRRAHLYASVEPSPGGGADPWAPGRFPYQVDFAEPTSTTSFSVPLTDIDAACGDIVTLAFHADVFRFDDAGNIVQGETAWAFGEEFENTARWGWSLKYRACCEGPEAPPSDDAPDAGTEPEPAPDAGTDAPDSGPAPDPAHGDCD